MFKMFKSFFLEIFFDHKDEYTFSSKNFNAIKVFVMVALVLSMTCNFFLFSSYVDLARRFILLTESVEKNGPILVEKDSKK